MRRLFALRLAIWTGVVVVAMSILFGVARVVG
jgi:hypothetical protein